MGDVPTKTGSSTNESERIGSEARITLHNPKNLYRLLERVFAAADDSHGGRRLLGWCVREFFAAFHRDLGLRAARLYSAQNRRYRIVDGAGEGAVRATSEILADRVGLEALSRDGFRVWTRPSEASEGLALPLPLAGLVVEEPRARHLVFVAFATPTVSDEAEFVLRTLRAVLSARILQNRWGERIREAMEVQRSCLPSRPPQFPGYDIAALSVPAEDVGGDLYDFIVLGDRTLAITVADASGHGLGAALLARDVRTGLRMGAGRQTKVVHTLEQLNRVLHDGGVGSSFVSAFYGELEAGGDLLYVNAGHPEPILVNGRRIRTLARGGIVLGPTPDARFRRHFGHLEPGATLVLYTDGILERRNEQGDLFEIERLQKAVLQAIDQPADGILHAIFSAAEAFGPGTRWDDDATVIVVKRAATAS
jgi:hypothetical protein